VGAELFHAGGTDGPRNGNVESKNHFPSFAETPKHEHVCTYIYKCPTRCNSAQYIFFISLQKLLYMFRVPFTPIIRSIGNCSRQPLVQVTCRDRLEVVSRDPLESTHSQATTALHHGQIKT
jgi:hypothetical protein